MSPHIHPNPEAARRLYERFAGKGAVTMLNLIRYRKTADYSDAGELKPDSPVSGEGAYRRYMKEVAPLLEKVGGELKFFGTTGEFLIGPTEEQWDAVLLVEYPSIERFVEMAQSQDYLAIAGHRTAALSDSRLLPMKCNR